MKTRVACQSQIEISSRCSLICMFWCDCIYCYKDGRHVIASASIPAVNQIRASDDYATGVKMVDPANANLYIGTSSLLAAALGLAPSKDVFWSSSTEKYDKSWFHKPRYPSAHESFPELQAAVATLSAGPVGPGDEVCRNIYITVKTRFKTGSPTHTSAFAHAFLSTYLVTCVVNRSVDCLRLRVPNRMFSLMHEF